MRLQPLTQRLPRHDACGDTFEEGDSVVLFLRLVNPPAVAVALHELGVCLDDAIATSGRGESRPGERHETVEADQRLRRDAENAFRDGEVVGEIEVVDAVRYRASLSRMAWFSFMNRSSLFWNARSERFASTCSVIA